jgi:hypothetical protein
LLKSWQSPIPEGRSPDDVSRRRLAAAFVASEAHLLNVGPRPSTRPPPFARVIGENASQPSRRRDKVRANKKMERWWPICCLPASRLAVAADEPEGVRLGTSSGGDLSAESSSGLATDGSSYNDDNNTEAAERLEGASRSDRLALQMLHHAIHRIEWTTPFIGVERCSELNGYLCGIGIRLGKYGVSVLRITESLSRLCKQHAEPPGAFRFGQTAEVDISRPNADAVGSKFSSRR